MRFNSGLRPNDRGEIRTPGRYSLRVPRYHIPLHRVIRARLNVRRDCPTLLQQRRSHANNF